MCRPKNTDDGYGFGFDASLPVLAPPPKVEDIGFNDTSPRFNPFDQKGSMAGAVPDELGVLPFGNVDLYLLFLADLGSI